MAMTREEYLRDAEDMRPCRRCHGTGWTPQAYSRGPEPCGCTDPDEPDEES